MSEHEKQGRPGRPAGKVQDVTISLRYSSDIHERVQEQAAREQERTGYTISVSDIVRRAVLEYLEKET